MLKNIADRSDPSIEFYKSALNLLFPKYEKLNNKNICIWGTSLYGRTIKKILENYEFASNIKCFVSSFHKENSKNTIDDLTELSPKEALEQFKDSIFIVASDYSKEITLTAIATGISPDNLLYVESGEFGAAYEKLLRFYFFSEKDSLAGIDIVGDIKKWFSYYADMKNSGRLTENVNRLLEMLDDTFSKNTCNDIINFFLTGDVSLLVNSYCSDTQYFSNDYYSIKDEEVFFDCGAYDGDSVKAFLKFNNNKFKKIIAFEPNKANAKEIEKLGIEGIEIKNAAVGDYDGTVSFDSECVQGGRIGVDASEKIAIYKIDSFINENPTFIKMDIEGAEMAALEGAKKTIQEMKPKLAICIYHRPQDIFEIPFYIRKLNSSYRFKLRKHTRSNYEAVLYAY